MNLPQQRGMRFALGTPVEIEAGVDLLGAACQALASAAFKRRQRGFLRSGWNRCRLGSGFWRGRVPPRRRQLRDGLLGLPCLFFRLIARGRGSPAVTAPEFAALIARLRTELKEFTEADMLRTQSRLSAFTPEAVAESR